MPKLILPDHVACLDAVDLRSKNLIEILAAISQQKTALDQFKSQGIPVFVAGHLRTFKRNESDHPLHAKEGDIIDQILVKALNTESSEYQRILLKLTCSKFTTLKRNQKPLAIIAHNENLDETPLLTFVYPKNSYTIRWSKETLKVKYPTIKSSESQTLTLMLGDDAFSILKVSELSGWIINLLKSFSKESSFETMTNYINHVSEHGTHGKLPLIAFISGVASGLVGLSLTPVLFTALYSALLSGASSGIITAAIALLALIAATVLTPVSIKYNKLSSHFKTAAIKIKDNTPTADFMDL